MKKLVKDSNSVKGSRQSTGKVRLSNSPQKAIPLAPEQQSASPTPPSAKPSPAKPPEKSKGLRLLGLGVFFTGIATISATAGAMLAVSLASTPFMQRQLSPAEASVFNEGDRFSSPVSLQLPELTRPVNILVLGVKVLSTDLKEPPASTKQERYQTLVNSFEGLTDTMLLLRFEPTQKRFIALSIPRDTRTYIADRGMAKINEANYLGGPALSAKSVSELLGGVGIDRYIRINVQGVEALVEALGGVTVHVPQDMKYQDDSQHLYINLKAGRQHLNGNQALQILRFRHDNKGDIGRIQRQQMVMRALIEQALNPATVARLPKILGVIQSHIDTNLTVEEMAALTGFGAQVKRAKTKMLMVPGDFSAPGQYDASYWLPQPNRIRDLMAQYFDFGTPNLEPVSPDAMKIAIQDSTKQKERELQGVVDDLRESGFGSVYLTQPWSEPLAVTQIVAEWGDIASAEAVRRSLGFGEVRIENTGDLNSDVTVKLGQDAWRSAKQLARSKGLTGKSPDR